MEKIFFSLFLAFCIVHGSAMKINFKNMDINRLIEITSLTLGKSILNPYQIQAKINYTSIKVHDKNDLLAILKVSLLNSGYDLIQEENLYKVIRSDNIKTELIELKHAKVNEIYAVIKELAYKDIQVSMIKDLNALLLIGKQNTLIKASQIIQKLDVERKQVYVKAKIIEVNNEKVKHVGIQYGIFKSTISHGALLSFSSSLNGVIPSFNTSNAQQSFPTSSSILALGAAINLLKDNHAINIVSEPSLLCINNQTSSIYVGEKKSIKTASSISDTGSTKESFLREDIGLTLKITPQVSNSNKVVLNIHTQLENFSQTSVTNNQPDTSKKLIHTTAIVNNAESVILGGLIENREENITSSIPILSQIPIFGSLFQDQNSVKSKKSLVIIITPYIVKKDSNLTKLREELAALYALEEAYLKQSLLRLNQKKKINSKVKKKQISLHEQRMKALGF